jgi:hypothetical protein
VKAPQAPRLDERRTEKFAAELRERAQAWIPGWALTDGEGDFGRALLEIAARFSSEVAERFDGAGDKMRRGFLDWLGVPRIAARPARLPVVFKLVDAAPEAVLAAAQVKMQVDSAGVPVVFETEQAVRVVPGRLEVVVGVDAEQDAYYLPPPGLSDLRPAESLPTQWRLKSFAAPGAAKLQLDPESGLVAGMILRANGQQYTIDKVDKDLVTIEPPLVTELAESSLVSKVTTFAPFGGEAHNWQEHALYLGDEELLNIEAEATIEIVGATGLPEGHTWEYSGKRNPNDEVGWLPLTIDDEKQKNVDDALVFKKPKGAIELMEVNGQNSRWIRAFRKTIVSAEEPFTSDELSIRINASGCGEKLPCPHLPDAPVSPAAEAMANTTPLVLENVFFPLGKEPRQFDAFYLGSQEAFSKTDAQVQICFEMADPTFAVLSVVREGMFANTVLAGVAQDRALHLLAFDVPDSINKFRQREPLQPPLPGFQGQAQASNTVTLDMKPGWRLPVWSEPNPAGFLIGVSAGDAIWIWREDEADQNQSGWISFGELPSDTQTPARPVDGLVYLADTSPALAALRGGQLFIREWPNGSTWGDPVRTEHGGTTIELASIVPVLVDNGSGQLITSKTAGMVGVGHTKELFHISIDGTCTRLLATFNFNASIRPVAIKIAGERIVAAVTEADPPELVTSHTNTTLGRKQVTLDANTKVAGGLEVALIDGVVYVLTSVHDNAGGRLTSWAPYATGAVATWIESSVTAAGGRVGGAPTIFNRHAVIPGDRADILISDFEPARRHLEQATVEIGVVVPDSIPVLAANDLIVRLVSGEPVKREIKIPPGLAQVAFTKDGEVFYKIASDFPSGATDLNAYNLSALLTGSFTDPDLTLDAADDKTAEDDWLWIQNEFYQVAKITTNNLGHRVATLVTTSSQKAFPPPGNCQYVRPITTGGRVAHFIQLDPTAGGNGDWDANRLMRNPLIFPGKLPQQQLAKAFSVTTDVTPKPVIVVFEQKFQSALANPFGFVVEAAFGEWQRDAGDTSSNPELSWEYWNGKGWWKLPVERDDTQNLKTTGSLKFTVPQDIASSDWAGKTNFWIRARLVGGDYGREKVTAKTTILPGGVTEQTIERSSEGIRAPLVVGLYISYAVCTDVQPTYVLAQDSGSFRDQSEANRMAGAIVEAFVPLAETLRRLSSTTASLPASNACPPECDDSSGQVAAAQPLPIAGAVSATQSDGGRAIFIGVAGLRPEAPANVLSGAPVNVLLLVDQREHTSLAPMAIHALAADHFDPIVADDTTRALGEAGLLSMAFTEPPTPRELFGRTLTWLRLTPKAGASSADWKPSLRGAYLNAVWASATETLKRELLGSSDGRPNMLVRLARPPVLDHSLELRVKEPLSDEERAALHKADKASVLNEVNGLPGDWVLWKQVIDPSDEPADARVYALDEATGEIRFGDGRHGRIPPIGRDAIVAFSYQRTEPGPPGSATVPGNLIAARTALNLVSPVATVESVTAADQAAGGAPPEDDDRVLRFGYSRLRHRDRAVTLHDLEDLAVQSSPDIVQARAVPRRDSIRLVVVMKGRNPVPTAAQVRELRRLLLASAPVSLSVPNALSIEGPKVRRLRIELQLRVERLDHAGALAQYITGKLTDFFNTATGGIDKDGWALSLSPSADDIAFVLLDAPHLDSIEDVTLYEIALDGSEQPWPDTLEPTELAMLHDDWLRIQFATAEVEK